MTLFFAGLLAGCGLFGREASAPTPVEPTSDEVPTSAAEASPPNLLFVVWDTVRADRTSLYGYGKPTTPKTAAWAAERGVVYDNAVSPGVFTLPSHASLFTALPPRTHGVNADQTRLSQRFDTFAEVLSGTGYATWAFVANPYLMEDSGLLDGFGRIERPWDPAWKTAVKRHIKDKLVAEDASTPLSPAWPRKDSNNRYLFKEAGPVAADAFAAFLAARSGDQPFFAFVNLMEAHLPRIPSQAARQAMMTPEEIERSYQVAQHTMDFHEYMGGVRDYDALDLAAISGVYDASLRDLDDATGALLDVLDRAGVTEQTIVVLTSDHGEHLGEHRLLLHKYAVYNPLSRVPLVLSWPGHLEPGRVAEPFDTTDALVRALELGEVPLPGDIRARIAARPRPVDGAVVTEYGAVAEAMVRRMVAKHRRAADRKRFDRTWSALDNGEWKVIEGSDGTVELFRVDADPLETDDRVGAMPELAASLRAQLAAWRAAVPEFSPEAGEAGNVPMSEELRQGLEALGYVE